MAGLMFLKLDGIDGESQDTDHTNEIDIESFSLQIHNPSSSERGGTGHGTGQSQISEMHITKSLDKSSPTLWQKCAAGDHIETAIITVCAQAGESEKIDYLKITMHDVMITQVQNGGSNSSERPQENLILNFLKIEKEYQQQDDKGKKQGGPVRFARDLQQNRPM
jgi:type VI secretion system secreted protein Hcp